MKKNIYILLIVILGIGFILFKIKFKQEQYHYKISSGEVIFDNYTTIDGVDVKSFSIILDGPRVVPSYAKDKNNIYIENSIIPGADIESFKVVFFNIGKNKYQAPYISKDKNHVYFGNDIILLANPKTFKYLGANFAKDDKNIFYETMTIKGADKESFIRLGGSWAKDANNVYLCNNMFSGENSNSFVYSGMYALGKHRYHSPDCSISKILTGNVNMPYEEFDQIVKDKNNYYFKGQILTGIELETYLEKIK